MTTLMEMCAETIAQKEKEIVELKAQIEQECKEHREAMLVADKTIKTLEKALELACKELNKPYQHMNSKIEIMNFIDNKGQPIALSNYFVEQAQKELKKSE